MSAAAPFLAPSTPEPHRDPLDWAILKTVAYASLFQYPLSLGELHIGLMERRLSAHALEARLRSDGLRNRIEIVDGFVVPRGRRSWLALRRIRKEHSRRLVEGLADVLGIVRRFPHVRMAALSGACARGNATDDDVDLFIVARSGRVWTVALGLFLLAKWKGVRNVLCVNYLIDEDALALAERDLFTAAEIVGLRALTGGDVLRRFVQANPWVLAHFPNFFAAHAGVVAPPAIRPRGLRLGGACLEVVSRAIFGTYLRLRTRGAPGVVLDRHRLKLHTRDHRGRLLEAFRAATTGLDGEEGA